MSFVEEHTKALVNIPDQWRATVRKCWEDACKFDGVDPNEKFVVFSDDNPYVPFHNRAVQNLREAEAQAAAFGYVGLQIDTGRKKRRAMLPKQKMPKR